MISELTGVETGLTADTYRDKTPIKCLRSGSFWMLVTINAIGSGAGLTLLNNLGEEVRSCTKLSSLSGAVSPRAHESQFCVVSAEAV